MDKTIIDLIYDKRMTAGVLTSRGRNTDNIDTELTELWKKYPREYKEAEKQIYKDISN